VDEEGKIEGVEGFIYVSGVALCLEASAEIRGKVLELLSP
jgi:hypothetical protein